MIGINGTLALMVATAAGLTPPAASAQHAQHGTSVTRGADAGKRADTPATRAYRAANAKMHGAMDVAFTGDADADFMRAMAEIELRYGRDPAVRRLAAEVVATQRREIAEMRAWLARRETRK